LLCGRSGNGAFSATQCGHEPWLLQDGCDYTTTILRAWLHGGALLREDSALQLAGSPIGWSCMCAAWENCATSCCLFVCVWPFVSVWKWNRRRSWGYIFHTTVDLLCACRIK
jgi:hypothetical protein